MINKKPLIAALVSLACISSASAMASHDLVNIKSSADELKVNLEHDYSQYSSIYVAPLSVDNTEVDLGSISARNRMHAWEFNEERKADMQGYYEEQFVTEFVDHSGLPRVDAPQKDSLVIKAGLVELKPANPVESDRYPGRANVYSDGAGDMTIAMELSNAHGEILALAEDDHEMGPHHRRYHNNSVSNRAEVKRTFDQWGRKSGDAVAELISGESSEWKLEK